MYKQNHETKIEFLFHESKSFMDTELESNYYLKIK